MERIRRSLKIDNEKFEETCCADLISKKTSQKFNRSLSDSSSMHMQFYAFESFEIFFRFFNIFNIFMLLCTDDNSLGSTCIYKNVDVRLKRLHNKILKDIIYERKITLNDDKSQSQQNYEPVIKNMTKDKLIEQAEQKVLYEEMDWEPMKDEEIALEVYLKYYAV